MADITPQGTRFGGSSGASLEFRYASHTAMKKGNDRVLSQGLWIVDHQSLALPSVYWVDEKKMAYGMEILSELPKRIVDTSALTYEMVRLLDVDVWSAMPEVDLIMDAHVDKMQALLVNEPNSTIAKVAQVVDKIKWDQLPRCLTHGDPTYDNVMVRPSTGDIVLTDPIPSTVAVPDLRCVDIGKMLQSMYGFEMIRYGDKSFTVKPPMLQIAYLRSIIPNYSHNEWLASQYWCAVHFFRAAPYMPDERIRDSVTQQARRILHLL